LKKATPVLEDKFISFDKTPIYFEERGNGEAIVYVYGLACLINHWHFQIDYFSKNFKTLAFDIRGHHKSGLPENADLLNLESSAKDISYLLRHLGIKKAHFVGHSLGAQTILKTYELFPELFKSISFINGFSQNPIKGMFGLDIVEPFFNFVKDQYAKNPEMLEGLWRAGIKNPISMWGAGILGGFNLKLTQFKDIEIYAQGVANVPISVFIKFFEEMMSFNGDDIAKKISVPTLIISGENDKVTPTAFQRKLHEQINGSEFVVIPYGSHCTQLDFPDYVNLKLEKFLNSI
jgi:pimeloyl-ACP methyl ester carboxylesterase